MAEDALAAAQAAFSESINAGRQHAQAEDYAAAQRAFDAATRIFVLHPQGYLERGCVTALLGDLPTAVDDLGVALALSEPDEDVLRAHFNRGSALLEVRQAGRAVFHFEPTAAAGVAGAARLLARARSEAAESGFDAATMAQSCCARGFELLGSAPIVALSCFTDARRYDPSLLWAVHGLGLANGAIRRLHHARNAFSEVLKEAQGSMRAEALFNRASLLPKDASDAETAQACEDLRACVELGEDPAVPFPADADPVAAGATLDGIRRRLAALEAG